MSVKNSETPQITVLDATASGNFLDKRALASAFGTHPDAISIERFAGDIAGAPFVLFTSAAHALGATLRDGADLETCTRDWIATTRSLIDLVAPDTPAVLIDADAVSLAPAAVRDALAAGTRGAVAAAGQPLELILGAHAAQSEELQAVDRALGEVAVTLAPKADGSLKALAEAVLAYETKNIDFDEERALLTEQIVALEKALVVAPSIALPATAQLRRKANELESEVAAIRSSTSWKLTAPVRAVKTKLDKLRGRPV